MCTSVCVRARARVCLCVYIYIYMCVCVCVCVCVYANLRIMYNIKVKFVSCCAQMCQGTFICGECANVQLILRPTELRCEPAFLPGLSTAVWKTTLAGADLATARPRLAVQIPFLIIKMRGEGAETHPRRTAGRQPPTNQNLKRQTRYYRNFTLQLESQNTYRSLYVYNKSAYKKCYTRITFITRLLWEPG